MAKSQALAQWQTEYDLSSRVKGKHHWQSQSHVSQHPWFYRLPRNGLTIKIISRLRTGHGLCGQRRAMFKLSPSPFCRLCGEVDNLEHQVLDCVKFSVIRDKYSFHMQTNSLADLLKKADLSVLN